MELLPDPLTSLQATIAYLRSPQAIRERCGQLFQLACADRLAYFRVNLSQLEQTANYVVQVTKETYPDLKIPFHSRWRHFEVGGLSRLQKLDQQLSAFNWLDRVKAKVDLAVVSVLLDAGAGANWQYIEADSEQIYQRSEGLAVASLHLFCDGLFSSHRRLQVDAIALQSLTLDHLANGFQVSQTNPLVGLEGRLNLLHRLGTVLTQQPNFFGAMLPRPGNLVDYLLQQSKNDHLPASTILTAILTGLADIWAGRITLTGVNLGDTWSHSALDNRLSDPTACLVPFHKLSQWLTYSLLEPLQELGLTITGLDDLTGLPEYRNGGLCVDLGLLQVKDPIILAQPQLVGSEAIVEWRALTVSCLDRIADAVRHQLQMTADTLPLVNVLQGGTWTAGRKIAGIKRNGLPPIQIASDGTVF